MNSFGGEGMEWRPPFTAAQWQELKHQALIFKYMVAGVPVPPELLIPIRRSFEALSSPYFHHPALGYCYYGKKLDPEPGRCRRTDGKKWRCSKEAYPDSKYCERHMHRGRNRSRKPVETQALSQSQLSSSSSTVTSLAPSGSSGGSFQSAPLHSVAAANNNPQGPFGVAYCGASSSQLHVDPASYGLASKDISYLQGIKPNVGERSFLSEASGSSRGIGVDSLDSPWSLMPSRETSFQLSNTGSGGSLLPSHNSQQLHSLQDVGQPPISSLSRQQLHSFLGSEFGSSEPAKHDDQPPRPFFDEWPKTRDSWSDLDDDRSKRTSYSTTQLSISIPMASSDFSTTTSRSPNDD